MNESIFVFFESEQYLQIEKKLKTAKFILKGKTPILTYIENHIILHFAMRSCK